MMFQRLGAAIFAAYILFVASGAVAQALGSRTTYFLRLRTNVPPVSLLAASIYSPRPKVLLHLEPGQIIRAQLTAAELNAHLSACDVCGGEWIPINSVGSETMKIWVQHGEVEWLDAYSTRLLLKPKTSRAALLSLPELAGWDACRSSGAGCLTINPDHDEIELVETRIVSDSKEFGSQWKLFYKIHIVNKDDGTWREGWARADDLQLASVTKAEMYRAPALVDDLLRARGNTEKDVEGLVPRPVSTAKFHLDLHAGPSMFNLGGRGADLKPRDDLYSGLKLGLKWQAPLVYDLSTNIWASYGQILGVQRGANSHYSETRIGGEMLYGRGATEAKYKFGLGGEALVFNNAPSGSFRTLANAFMDFAYDSDGILAAYRGGPVANSASGLSFANYQMVFTGGWHLNKNRHDWTVVATYSYLTVKVSQSGEHLYYVVYNIGLQKGF